MSELILFSSVEEMAAHARENDLLLVSFNGTVYDLSDFEDDHPGGGWAVRAFVG